MSLVLVRGSGDVGSAVAVVLFRAGHRVVLHDRPAPAHPRRGMALTDALYDGAAQLEGALAKHARSAGDLVRMADCMRAIPVTDRDFDVTIELLRPQVLVDGRMRKRRQPDARLGLAPLTVGLGPNFEVGTTADVVIETAWGERLGAVIREGRARDLSGDPRPIGGYSRERFVYAPVAGTFRTVLAIGDTVASGDVVGAIGDVTVTAPLSGRLRGLAHDGARVETGAKVVEVDPRGEDAVVFGLGERPLAIAEAVREVVRDLPR